MMYVFNETYETACDIPVVFRKWFIDRYNLQKKKEHEARNGKQEDDVNQPLSTKQKQKFVPKK